MGSYEKPDLGYTYTKYADRGEGDPTTSVDFFTPLMMFYAPGTEDLDRLEAGADPPDECDTDYAFQQQMLNAEQLHNNFKPVGEQ